MPNGFTYSLQELAFFSWFYGAPTLGLNGWFQQWEFPDRRWTALHLSEWLPGFLFADLQPQVSSNLGLSFWSR